MVLIFPSLAFCCSSTNNVEVELSVQLCKGFINKQIIVTVTPWQRHMRLKIPYFLPFEANNFKTRRWKFFLI